MKRTTQPAEKQKIVIGINSLTNSQYPAYTNHIQVFYQLGRQYPNIDFCLVNPSRMAIDRMRNLAAETALQIGASHLLFIDDDVIIPYPFDFLSKMLAADKDIIAGDVIIRGYPFNHMLFKWNKAKTGLYPYPKLPEPRGVISVGAVGFSLCLIKTWLLSKLSKPYFVTGVANTEDIYFCINVDKNFPEATIAADTTIQCGHILWPEIVDSTNKRNYKLYHERQFGKPSKEDKEAAFRGEKYLIRTKAALHVK